MLETLIMDSDTGVNADEEVEISDNLNATPLASQRDVQALDSDGDVEISDETPIVLRRQKKKPAPALAISEAEFEPSEVEPLEVEESQQRKVSLKGNKANKGKARELAQVCFFLID